jgi:hypothetical protein
MRYLVLILFTCGFMHCFAQTNFIISGDWTNASNWSSGIPDGNDDVSISFGVTATVNADGVCLDLSQFLSSLLINAGATLIINGIYTASTQANANINNGTLILKGDLKPAIGTTVLTINGGVTTVGGLTFPSLTIK